MFILNEKRRFLRVRSIATNGAPLPQPLDFDAPPDAARAACRPPHSSALPNP